MVRIAHVIVGLVLCALCASAVHAQSVPRKELLEPLARLLIWLEDVQQHVPGTDDAAAREVAGWSRIDLETLTADIKKVSEFVYQARQNKVSRTTLRLYGRPFTLADLEKVFLGNPTLLRGAILHADVAMYVVDDLSRRTTLAQDQTYVVDDGRGQGRRNRTVHWRIGRLVLDAVAPSPLEHAGTLLWYRASSAFLLREGHFAEVREHLERASQLFLSSPDLCLDNAYYREKNASPEIQAAVQDLKSAGTNLNVESDRMELGRAERFLRQVLALDPTRVDARIRLGRVLGELGRHQDAAAQLREALAVRPDGESSYFAELFLGREEEALGNREAARAHFQAAADVFPKAQSPHLALSRLARQSGDRTAALSALQQVTSLPPEEDDRDDPWWRYYSFHLNDVAALMAEARERAFEDNP